MKLFRGFTAIETVVTFGAIAVTAGFAVPMYRNYQIRSDINQVAQRTIQGLRWAQASAQAGYKDSQWGFYVKEGVLFWGDGYAVRDGTEGQYFVPKTIETSGIEEVVFSRIDGIPNNVGTITISGINGQYIDIEVGKYGVLESSGIAIPDSNAFGGDTSGDTGGGTSSSSSSTTSGGTSSSSSSTTSGGTSSSSSSSGGGTAGGDVGGTGGGTDDGTCEDRFAIGTDNSLTTTSPTDVTVKALGSEITYGAGGPEIQVRADISTDGGGAWSDLFADAEIDGGETQITSGLTPATQLGFRFNARYSWWFNRTYDSIAEPDRIIVLKNGDDVPNYAGYGGQDNLASFIEDYVDAQGKVSIGQYDVIIFGELGSELTGPSADFQDVVLLVTFSQPVGVCGNSTDPRFKIDFNRLENSGTGNAQQEVFVGPSQLNYLAGQWISLADVNGNTIIDSGLVEDVPGLAVSRHTDHIRVLNHGSHATGNNKEIIDAMITFENVDVQYLLNDDSSDKSENPFDGVINDGPGGDEATALTGSKSILYQTRVTVADDAIKIYWLESTSTSSSSSSATSGTSTSSSSATSGTSTSSTGGTDSGDGSDTDEGPDACGVSYTLTNGTIILNGPADVTFRALGSHSQYGDRGPEIATYARATLDNGATYQSLYNYRDIDGSEVTTFADVASGSRVGVEAEGRYSWLFRNRLNTQQNTSAVKFVKRNQPVPGETIYQNTSNLQSFLQNVISNGKFIISRNSLLLLFEMQTVDNNADFQDLVMEVIIEKPASEGVCGAITDDSTSSEAGTTTSSSSGSSDSSSSSSSESTFDICHFPPGNPGNSVTINVTETAWNAHNAHGDRKGTCESDSDGDGIANRDDFCPNTFMPETIPNARTMLFRRYAFVKSSPIMYKGPRKKVSSFTITDTKGCTCEQLVDVAENKKSYHFKQYPRLRRQMRSLFPFYTRGARSHGCGRTIINMVKNF